MSAKKTTRPHGAPGIGELLRLPLVILVSLVLVLALNIGAAFVPLGGSQFAVNVLLALASVVLIALFFMELESEPATSRLFAASGPVWIVIMLMLLFGDFSPVSDGVRHCSSSCTTCP